MRRVKTIDQKMAGPDHAVTTVISEMTLFCRTPCADCPWRKDAVWRFPPEAFINSANTGAVRISANDPHDVNAIELEINLASRMFGCHTAGTEKPAICAGYILEGQASLGWRVAAAKGKFDPLKVTDNGLDLFKSYYDMAVANGVDPEDSRIDLCRDRKRRKST